MLSMLRAVVRGGGITELSTPVVDFVASLLSAFNKRTGGQQSPTPTGWINSQSAGIRRTAGTRGRELEQGHRTQTGSDGKTRSKFHLRSLYEKLGVGSRVLAIAVAREKGLLVA